MRAWVVLLFSVLGCAQVGCAVLPPTSPLTSWERKSVFQPARYPAGEWEQTSVLVEDAYFTASDGVKLHGWYARHPQPLAHAVLLHGNAGNVTLLAESIRLLNRRHGLSVLALDYRGFGRSEGKPTEQGVVTDARAARDWLARKEGIANRDVMLMGVSLGGGVALQVAEQEPCRGLVLVNTFTSLPDVAQHHVPWLPMSLMMTMRMNSLEAIRRYEGPLLISHADADQVIPFEQGQLLFDTATTKNKVFIRNEGAGHNDPQPEAYRVALDQFIAALPPISTPAAPTNQPPIFSPVAAEPPPLLR